MAQDLVSLYNLALSAGGSTVLLSSVSENGPEAEQCGLWYPYVRDSVLRAARWSAAKAVRRLALDVERDDSEDWVSTDPMPGWKYSYTAPSDMLYPRYLADYTMFTTYVRESVWRIQTNTESPILVYTKKETDVSIYDSELYFAVAYMLAAHIAMPLHGKAARAKNAFDMAMSIVTAARVSSANEESQELDWIPEGMAARGYAATTSTRFYYPHDKMLMMTGAPLA